MKHVARSKQASAPVRASADAAHAAEPPLHRHLQELLDARLRALRKHWHFEQREDSARAIHDLRVASRRLRALVAMLDGQVGLRGARALARSLQRLTGALGQARDWDVRLQLIAQRRKAARTERARAAFDPIREHFERQRNKAAKRARKALAAMDAGALQRRLRSRVTAAVGRLPRTEIAMAQLARDVLERRLERAIEQAPRPGSIEDVHALHRLRIAIKKLRYSLELFEPVLGTRYRVLHARASALQALLGDHHDLWVLGEIIADLPLKQLRSSEQKAALDALLQAIARERAALARRYARSPLDGVHWRKALSTLGAQRPSEQAQ